jgi:putative ABC transport system permease protein
LDRFFNEVHTRYDEVETLLSFGASKWEAVMEPVKQGLRAGMIPIINSLMVVGIVSLPGMMTGQILGGVSPTEAVKYQIVVMLMITASVAIGSLIFISLSFKKVFNPDGTLNID